MRAGVHNTCAWALHNYICIYAQLACLTINSDYYYRYQTMSRESESKSIGMQSVFKMRASTKC